MDELKQTNAALSLLNAALEKENTELKARLVALESENIQLSVSGGVPICWD